MGRRLRPRQVGKRLAAAEKIIEKGWISEYGSSAYVIVSKTYGDSYTIFWDKELKEWDCPCFDHKHNHVDKCKHIIAIEIYRKNKSLNPTESKNFIDDKRK